MDHVTIVAIALGLSFDSFAVSLSCGVVKYKILFKEAVKIASILALFQGGLTIAGYFLGSVISQRLQAIDHWIALGLLSFLGIKMLYDGLHNNPDREVLDFSRFHVILTIALGTSIDAFAVGISFALFDVKIWESGIIIAIITFLASMVAIRIGKSAGGKAGSKVEIFGGLILIATGIKIFLEHIL
jgi:putative Mn2+ efflux pump MntP